jgi:hypothetical protein
VENKDVFCPVQDLVDVVIGNLSGFLEKGHLDRIDDSSGYRGLVFINVGD